jgi:hypothetical protein
MDKEGKTVEMLSREIGCPFYSIAGILTECGIFVSKGTVLTQEQVDFVKTRFGGRLNSQQKCPVREEDPDLPAGCIRPKAIFVSRRSIYIILILVILLIVIFGILFISIFSF